MSRAMHPELFTIPGINFTVPSYGAMMLVGFLLATFWTSRLAVKAKADPDIVLNLGFVILIFGTIGARAFYVIHYWQDRFADQPAQIFNLRAGGLEFYGGFVAAFLACALYLWRKGLSVRLYADLVAPPLLLAMGLGRIGCFLFGCCWGGPAPAGLPWAVSFPYASPPHQRQWQERMITLPAELILDNPTMMAWPIPRQLLAMSPQEVQSKLDKAATALAQAKQSGSAAKIKSAQFRCLAADIAYRPYLDHLDAFATTPDKLKELARRAESASSPVHPSQLYGAVGLLLLACLTRVYLRRRRHHGMVMAVGFMLYAVQRFLEEIIRLDNPRDTFGLTVSQGVSIVIFLIAVTSCLVLRKMPLRSPKVAACASPETP